MTANKHFKLLVRERAAKDGISYQAALNRVRAENAEKQPVACRHCDDTGVVETGNNDLPCEHCAKGQTAVFNVGGGQTQTGEQVLRSYNPPGNLRQPPTWKRST